MAEITSLCVYCGSRDKVDQAYRDAAVDLGRRLGEAGVRLIYGGGHVGLMGLCADAALAAGGEVVGVIPEHLLKREVGHEDLTALHVTPDMHSRKFKMFELSDAFAVLPGGLGTLDETLEIVTWRQLRLHDMPIVLIDINGYWAPLTELLERTIQAGFAGPEARELFQTVTSVDQVLPAIAAAPQPRVRPRPGLL